MEDECEGLTGASPRTDRSGGRVVLEASYGKLVIRMAPLAVPQYTALSSTAIPEG
jgi:hypothetical protein